MGRGQFIWTVISPGANRAPGGTLPAEGTPGWAGRWAAAAGRLLTDPRHRTLRWVLFAGLAIRLVLAPLTSWDYDTPEFVQAGISTLYTGSPYALSLWANPPLAPFLSAPLLAIPTMIYGPQGLVSAVAAITPVTVQSGVNATLLPLPMALLAWKLPFILADLAVAIALYEFPTWAGLELPISRTVVAAAWFLNPLVIWASSVHGEVDSLAILLLLLALGAAYRQHWISAGLFLGLAIFTKGYPIVLLPALGAAALAWPVREPGPWRHRTGRLGAIALGLGVSALPFLAFLSRTTGVLTSKASNPLYGGISILTIFNGASPRGTGWYAAVTTAPGNAAATLLVLRALAGVAIAGSALLLGYRLHRDRGGSDPARYRWLLLASLWATTGILLADSAPQPENLVALIPLALLALPARGHRRTLIAVALLSAAGTLLYWAILTPLGMMYPLARLLGTPSILWVNGVVLAYIHTPLLRGTLWLIAGVVGGGSVLVLWGVACIALLPEHTLRRMIGGIRRRATVSPAPPA